MASYRPPMYGVRRGRRIPRGAQPTEPVEKAEEKPKSKKKSKKASKPKAKKSTKKLKKWSETDTKEDLYWLAKSLDIDKIKSKTPKAEMVKILRRHPGTQEIK